MSVFPLIRRISGHATPVLARLPVSANQITAVSLLTGLASGWCMMQGDRTWAIVGGLFLVLSYVLDNCDGEIARLKNQTSRLGMHFDTFVDSAVHTFFFAALGIGIRKTTGQDVWLWLGWIAAAGCAINYLAGFIVDARERRAGAHAQDSDAREETTRWRTPRGRREWIIYVFRELSRADFCFIVLALAVFDLTWVLLPLAAAGAHAYWALRFARGASRFRV